MPRRKSIALRNIHPGDDARILTSASSLLDFRPVIATPEPIDPDEYGLGELADFTLFGRVGNEIAAAAFFADRL